MGVQLQFTSFQPELTIREIIVLYAGIYGVSMPEQKLMEILQSIKLEDAAGIADFRLIDPPRASPKPVAPNRLLLMPLALLASLSSIFGALLVFMSVGLIVGLIVSGKGFYNTGMDFSNLHPTELPLWPLLFITIACGAVSGFHATQSPLMARCMQNEKSGRFIVSIHQDGVDGISSAGMG